MVRAARTKAPWTPPRGTFGLIRPLASDVAMTLSVALVRLDGRGDVGAKLAAAVRLNKKRAALPRLSSVLSPQRVPT